MSCKEMTKKYHGSKYLIMFFHISALRVGWLCIQPLACSLWRKGVPNYLFVKSYFLMDHWQFC